MARISLTNGDVTTKRGDSGDWVAAEVNAPLVEGDILETGPGARVELQLDYSNIIRLDGSTTVEIAELGDRRFRVRLLDGRMTYSELQGGEADIDIETPLVAVRPRERGRYEVEVRDGETTVQVRRGRTEIASVNGIEELGQGRMMVIRDGGPSGGPEFRAERALPSDAWDDWNQSRDDRLSRVSSYQHVSRDIVGAGDLDDHGEWRYISGYGNCWYPRGVGVGWAPYRAGRWAWIDYYGWNWVSYEPWGWAPYHYGRWFHTPGYGWGWWPGYRHHRHFYQPALVSFFGYGGGGGFSFESASGSAAWLVPLAPGEIYRPWYGRGFYGGRGNQTIIVDNSVNIYNNYRNARAHNGVTVVDANGFSRGQVNNPASLRGQELQRASLVRGQIPVAPTRESQGRVVGASARGGNSVAARAEGVRTFSRGGADATRSARLQRTPFDQQRNQIVTGARLPSERVARAAGEAGGVRAAPSNARGSLGGVQSPASRAGADSGRTVVRGGAAGTTSVSRSGVVAGSRGSSVRSGADEAGRSGGWRRVGEGSPAGRVGVTAPQRSSAGAPSTVVWLRAAEAPQRSRSGVDRSRVDRSVTRSSGDRSPSRIQRETSGGESRVPSSVSRVPRTSGPSDGGSSRINRAPSSSRSRAVQPMSGPQTASPRMSSPQRAPQTASPRMSSPSPSPSYGRGGSSGPSMRSAPSRAPGGGGGGGGGVRSAPSSAPGGGGGSGGGVRSAPGRSRSGGR